MISRTAYWASYCSLSFFRILSLASVSMFKSKLSYANVLNHILRREAVKVHFDTCYSISSSRFFAVVSDNTRELTNFPL